MLFELSAKHLFKGQFDAQFTNIFKLNYMDTSGRVVASIPTTQANSVSYLTSLIDEINAFSCVSNFSFTSIPKILGVSLSLNVNVSDPNTQASELLVVSEITNKTDTLIFLDCQIFDKESNRLIATGTHIKYIGF